MAPHDDAAPGARVDELLAACDVEAEEWGLRKLDSAYWTRPGRGLRGALGKA